MQHERKSREKEIALNGRCIFSSSVIIINSISQHKWGDTQRRRKTESNFHHFRIRTNTDYKLRKTKKIAFNAINAVASALLLLTMI